MIKQFTYGLKRPYHWLKTGVLKGLTSQIKYGFPASNIKIIAVTGTDGKTTTSTLVYHLLKTAGKKTGLISTVFARIGDKKIDTGLHVTAPTPDKLMSFIKQMTEEDTEYLVLELTSHGIYQYRHWGIKPEIAGLTNITHEHLDYHLNFDNYLEAKALLLKQAKTVVLNQDDQSFYKVKQQLNAKEQQILSYSHEEEIDPEINQAIAERFEEKYNQMNVRLAVKIAKNLGLETKEISKGIKTFPGVPGRMEPVDNNQGFDIYIDFAHTPNSLKQALSSLKKKLQAKDKNGRLIAVYGSAGLRDQSKRPAMGWVGVELADLVVFTAEDPRTENVWSIIRQMKEQLKTGHNKVVSIADRKRAIEFALKELAQPGDIVGIFGKGPEKSMCYGTKEYPWSDRKAAEDILAEMT